MYSNEVKEILEKLVVFDKMYEVIRFVDPVRKDVISYSNHTISESNVKCFNFWGKEKICDNCISIRSFIEDKTYVKIEYTANRIYMVTAIPYELPDRRIVIELLKDTTNSMIVDGGANTGKSEIYSMIDSMNNLLLKDDLTNVYNRRFINEKLPIDLINTELSKQDISIIMTDIDYFKKVNDTYGHLAGDEILKEFAGIIAESMIRESDWVARFGGEEFLICLPGASKEKAIEVAENIRKLVQEKEFLYNDTIIKITSSFGICTKGPNQEGKVESILEAADKKLYLAKNNGRNRVEY